MKNSVRVISMDWTTGEVKNISSTKVMQKYDYNPTSIILNESATKVLFACKFYNYEMKGSASVIFDCSSKATQSIDNFEHEPDYPKLLWKKDKDGFLIGSNSKHNIFNVKARGEAKEDYKTSINSPGEELITDVSITKGEYALLLYEGKNEYSVKMIPINKSYSAKSHEIKAVTFQLNQGSNIIQIKENTEVLCYSIFDAKIEYMIFSSPIVIPSSVKQKTNYISPKFVLMDWGEAFRQAVLTLVNNAFSVEVQKNTYKKKTLPKQKITEFYNKWNIVLENETSTLYGIMIRYEDLITLNVW